VEQEVQLITNWSNFINYCLDTSEFSKSLSIILLYTQQQRVGFKKVFTQLLVTCKTPEERQAMNLIC